MLGAAIVRLIGEPPALLAESNTLIGTTPALAIWAAVTGAWRMVLDTNVVGRLVPFQVIDVVEVNAVPTAVSVKFEPPVVTWDGEIWLSANTTTGVTVKAMALVTPAAPSLTVTE